MKQLNSSVAPLTWLLQVSLLCSFVVLMFKLLLFSLYVRGLLSDVHIILSNTIYVHIHTIYIYMFQNCVIHYEISRNCVCPSFLEMSTKKKLE